MQDIVTSIVSTPYGALVLGDFQGELVLCDWYYRKMRKSINQRISKGLNASFVSGESKLLSEVEQQLNQYFRGHLVEFDLPIRLIGSEFQQSVWNQLKGIPYGQTVNYSELSKKMGNPKAIRAVAAANGANALALIVPCHRVIGKNGAMVGYAGGLNVKVNLLQLEALSKQFELF